MIKWFDIIYYIRKEFNNINDLNETISEMASLDNLCMQTDLVSSVDKQNTAIELLKKYLHKNNLNIIDDNFFQQLNDAISFVNRDEYKNNINDVFAKISKLNISNNEKSKLSIYGMGLSYLKSNPDLFIDGKNLLFANTEEVSDDDIMAFVNAATNLKSVAKDNYSLDKLLKFIYDSKLIDTFNKYTNSGNNDNLEKLCSFIPNVLKKITNTSGFKNIMLSNFYDIMRSVIDTKDIKTDADFVELISKNLPETIEFDTDNAKTFVEKLPENNNVSIFEYYIKSALLNTNIADTDLKDIASKVTVSHKSKNGTYYAIITDLYKFASQSDKSVVNKSTFKNISDKMNDVLEEMLKAYYNALESVYNDLQYYYNVLKSDTLLQVFVEINNASNKFNILQKTYPLNVVINIASDFCQNKEYSNNKSTYESLFVNRFIKYTLPILNDDLKIENKVVFDFKNLNGFLSLINSVNEALENKQSIYDTIRSNKENKDFINAEFNKDDLRVDYKIKISNMLLKMISSFFATKFRNAEDTVKTENYKDYRSLFMMIFFAPEVEEALKKKQAKPNKTKNTDESSYFIMFNGRYLLNEDEDYTKQHNQLFDKIKKAENSTDIEALNDFIDELSFDDAEEVDASETISSDKEKNTSEENNNNNTADVLIKAADELKTSISNKSF